MFERVARERSLHYLVAGEDAAQRLRHGNQTCRQHPSSWMNPHPSDRDRLSAEQPAASFHQGAVAFGRRVRDSSQCGLAVRSRLFRPVLPWHVRPEAIGPAILATQTFQISFVVKENCRPVTLFLVRQTCVEGALGGDQSSSRKSCSDACRRSSSPLRCFTQALIPGLTHCVTGRLFMSLGARPGMFLDALPAQVPASGD